VAFYDDHVKAVEGHKEWVAKLDKNPELELKEVLTEQEWING
jgi:hypothetical protein